MISSINKGKLEVSKPRPRSNNYQDYSDEEKKEVLSYLFKLKLKVLKDGYLHFDDAYVLAFRYLQATKKIVNFIQKRFHFVFVDEMQDMDRHQYNILEMLFYDEGKSESIYQRIGDKNQAIFNGDISLDDIWIDRDIVRDITGSHRLSPQVALITNKFSLTNTNIKGLNDRSIKPHLFVYNIENKHSLVGRFLSVVEEVKNKATTIQNRHLTVSGISWVTDKKDDEKKITLTSFCPDFSRDVVRPKSEYSNVEQYLLCYDKQTDGLNNIATNIMNAILKSLRLSNVKDNDGKYFTKHAFRQFLNDGSSINDYNELIEFEKSMYSWSMNVIRGNHKKVLNEMRAYIRVISDELDKGCFIDDDFLYDDYALNRIDDISPTLKDSKVVFNSVHGVKGQTHFATLYMESFYYGNYESTLLGDVFNGTRSIDVIDKIEIEIRRLEGEIALLNESGKRGAISKAKQVKELKNKIEKISEYSKMVYVGFSRPTDLLAFAVEKSRFCELKIDTDIWDITYI
ncbi:UvrD-helicase domain-containing protein [Vibrio splendidus]